MAEIIIYYDEMFSEDSDIEKMIHEMLKESGKLLENAVKAELKKRLKHEGDSELLESIKISKVWEHNGDCGITVRPMGYSKIKKYRITRNKGTGKEYKTKTKYEVSNELKAIWKEYGIPEQQSPSPFFAPATRKVEEKVLNRLQEVYNKRNGSK